MTLRRTLALLACGTGVAALAGAIMLPTSLEPVNTIAKITAANVQYAIAPNVAAPKIDSKLRSPFQLKPLPIAPQPRTIAAASAVVPPSPKPSPNFHIVGIIAETVEPVVIVEEAGTRKSARLHVSERFNGWSIDRIEPRRITVSLEEQIIELFLDASAKR